MSLTKSEQMYEKYLQRQDDYLPIECQECKKTLCYSYGNIEGCLDETTILCEKCKGYLP